MRRRVAVTRVSTYMSLRALARDVSLHSTVRPIILNNGDVSRAETAYISLRREHVYSY